VSVTDTMLISRGSYTLAVTHGKCYKCGRYIANSEPVVWHKCWCGEPTLTKRNLGYGIRQDGSFGIGYGPCRGTPQPFCIDCMPDYINRDYYISQSCIACGRIFYVSRSLAGRRDYCLDSCINTVRARRLREQRGQANSGKSCVACGSTFDAVRSDQVYCGVACKQKAYRKRKVKLRPCVRGVKGYR
jgi:hypothetical protein